MSRTISYDYDKTFLKSHRSLTDSSIQTDFSISQVETSKMINEIENNKIPKRQTKVQLCSQTVELNM